MGNTRLSRFALYALLILTAFWTFLHLPEPDDSVRLSRFSSFSLAAVSSNVRRHLVQGQEQELKADAARSHSPSRSRKLYHGALNHYSIAAKRINRSAAREGYLNQTVERSLKRVRHKLAKERNVSRSPTGRSDPDHTFRVVQEAPADPSGFRVEG